MPLISIQSYSNLGTTDGGTPTGTVYLNQADKNPRVVVSNGGLTVYNASNTEYGTIRTNRSFSSGKIYWEITANITPINTHFAYMPSIMKPGTSISLIPGYNDPTGYSILSKNETNAALQGIYCCSLDLDNLVFTVTRNGKSWPGLLYKGNVALPNFAITAGPWFIATSPVCGDTYTMNFGDTLFSYPIPPGFTAANLMP